MRDEPELSGAEPAARTSITRTPARLIRAPHSVTPGAIRARYAWESASRSSRPGLISDRREPNTSSGAGSLHRPAHELHTRRATSVRDARQPIDPPRFRRRSSRRPVSALGTWGPSSRTPAVPASASSSNSITSTDRRRRRQEQGPDGGLDGAIDGDRRQRAAALRRARLVILGDLDPRVTEHGSDASNDTGTSASSAPASCERHDVDHESVDVHDTPLRPAAATPAITTSWRLLRTETDTKRGCSATRSGHPPSQFQRLRLRAEH